MNNYFEIIFSYNTKQKQLVMRKKARMYDEIRIISKFLWFKKVIGKEIRWFEHVRIKQKFIGYYTVGPFLLENWKDLYWEDPTYHGIT